MCEFEIEQNIKPPQKRKLIYPFQKLLVGESFFVKYNNDLPYNVRMRVYSSYRSYIDRHIIPPTYKIATKRMPTGVRIWRIA